MTHSHYDLLIIGAGPGGYVAAIRAAQLGLKVGVVEQEHLGGICLNWGCIPTKSLLRNAELLNIIRRESKEFGFRFENFSADFAQAIKRSRQVSERLVKGVGFLFRKNQIDHISGRGRLISPAEVRVEPEKRVYQAPHIIVATGARTRSLPGVTIDGEKVIGSRQALALTTMPESIIIVGAGPIGVEFAYIYNAYGAKVTLVEMLPRVLPLEDEEISKELSKALRRQGIQVLVSTRTEAVVPTVDSVRVQVQPTDGGEVQTLSAQKTLIAIGVRPNTEDIGLEQLGIQMERGFIKIDAYMRTNVPGIYAVGDVTGKLPLAHVASKQGIVAAEHIAGVETEPLDDEKYAMMPRGVYCRPQVASIGWTEAQARERGYEINVGKFPFLANGKALALGEREGFVKIVADARYGEILGAHLIGPEVTELLPELSLARAMELTPNEIARTVHAHPTLSESLMEAAHAVEGQAIHI
ncbi:MAG TPA: dihydrolipoyl dehydrogenase [Anaerolineae bacterium]|nr:dihydrolipoyl dehydrogenase [Anaerolineae bacterium]